MGLCIARNSSWKTANELLPVVYNGWIVNGRREKWSEGTENDSNWDMSHLHLICRENHIVRMRSIGKRNVLFVIVSER